MFACYRHGEIQEMARALFREERAVKNLDGWFLAREAALHGTDDDALPSDRKAADELKRMVEAIPLSISKNAVFAGTQRDAFARTYALINPTFKVENFCGYCDPTAVFDDIDPSEAITRERIETLRAKTARSRYIRDLQIVYDSFESDTSEVIFFMEQVTGHVVPDFRYALAHGLLQMKKEIEEKADRITDPEQKQNLQAMTDTLDCALVLAERYRNIAQQQLQTAEAERKPQLELMIQTLNNVPANGAQNLFEAIQSFMLLWEIMCLEQAPNPFAFSVGNADRIFEPYRKMTEMNRDDAAELFMCLLTFFNVGDRSWAISQNILISGRDIAGKDLTNETSYALLDAYYAMNFPQPILSVKLHSNTPEKLYRELGRFFFSPGVLTPSLFNDDTVFAYLRARNVAEEDLPDYGVAGCQEPLIMGKDSGNTTNTWLNLGKVLELVLNHGKSAITGKQLIPDTYPEDPVELLKNVRPLFYSTLQSACERMAKAGNGATAALSNLRVPFLSVFMGCTETGYDVRDVGHQGSKYNGSGCLIHGLSVVADSFVAIDHLLGESPQNAQRMLDAIHTDFKNDPEMRAWLRACPKYGNNLDEPDKEAAAIADRVSDMVSALRNNWNQPYRPDWSSPSTHLLYGYWVGALPDGRASREELNYGVDPLFGDANQGLGFRTLSSFCLPYGKFTGGYASHFGIDPKYFNGSTMEEKGSQMENRVIKPLFFNPENPNLSPAYLYMNVTTAETLRKVLENPKKYAPSGVYIMRIHGTFVNFLDLSPAIQQDIIKRLDAGSTHLA